MSEAKQDVAAIIVSIVNQRAAQLSINLDRRRITATNKLKDDFRINRHEAEVSISFALSGNNPLEQIDKVLTAIDAFDTKFYAERVRAVTETKSKVMQWMSYLERTLSDKEYRLFVHSLYPHKPNGKPTDEEIEGEHFHDYGIPLGA